jgi:hypothetical protein
MEDQPKNTLFSAKAEISEPSLSEVRVPKEAPPKKSAFKPTGPKLSARTLAEQKAGQKNLERIAKGG